MELNAAAIALKAKPFLQSLIFSISPQPAARHPSVKVFHSDLVHSPPQTASEISSFSARFTLQAIHCDNTRDVVSVYSV